MVSADSGGMAAAHYYTIVTTVKRESIHNPLPDIVPPCNLLCSHVSILFCYFSLPSPYMISGSSPCVLCCFMVCGVEEEDVLNVLFTLACLPAAWSACLAATPSRSSAARVVLGKRLPLPYSGALPTFFCLLLTY